MKGLRFVFGMLLTLVCSMQMAGQTLVNGEAFYIYRNDGDFNGFFYDEVQDMRYSKVGLDSIEYDEFVVQEIVTADSLYRIPLCAIDSIGFVQPTIELAPNLRITENLGIDKYITLVSEFTDPALPYTYAIYLSGDIPADLLPTVGDVVVNTTWTDDYYWRNRTGFAIKITDVQNRGDVIWLLGKDPNGMGDIFRRFITTERITADENGQPVRRMAGLKNVVTADGNAALNLLNISGTFTHEYEHSLAITIDYGVRVGLQATYDITSDHIFVKLALDEDISAQAGFSGTLTSTWEPEFSILPNWVGAIKFPAVLPIFETNVLPKTFFRASGSLSLKSTLPAINFKAKQLVIISDRTGNLLNCRTSSNLTSGYGDNDDNLFQPGDSKLSLNGFVQAGVKFDNTIKTNSWLKKIFQSSIGVQTYVGPKLSGTFDLSLPELTAATAGDLLGQSYYANVLRPAAITFSPCTADVEAQAEVNFLDYPPKSVKFWEGSVSLKDITRPLVAEVTDFRLSQDDKFRTAIFDLAWSGQTLFGHDIGVAIYKSVHDGYSDEEVLRNMTYHFNGDKEMHYTPDLKPGCYLAVPLLQIAGCDIPIDQYKVDRTLFPAKQAFEIMPTLQVSVTDINLPAHGSANDDPAVTTFTYTADAPVEVDAYCTNSLTGGSADFAEIMVDQATQTITIMLQPNTGRERSGEVAISWKNSDSTTGHRLWLSVPFHQRGKE